MLLTSSDAPTVQYTRQTVRTVQTQSPGLVLIGTNVAEDAKRGKGVLLLRSAKLNSPFRLVGRTALANLLPEVQISSFLRKWGYSNINFRWYNFLFLNHGHQTWKCHHILNSWDFDPSNSNLKIYFVLTKATILSLMAQN